MVIKIFHMIVVYLLTFFVWPLNKRLFFSLRPSIFGRYRLLTLSATFCARPEDRTTGNRSLHIDMLNTNILTASLVVFVSVLLLFSNNEFYPEDFILRPDGNILIPDTINAGSHVYPYMATIVSMTCLLVLVLIIICFGSQFGGG